MKSREPAGWERGGGSSAESPVQAWAGDGSGGKTSGTVRGPRAAGALSAYRTVTPSPGVYPVGRSAPLPAFFLPHPPFHFYFNLEGYLNEIQ